MPAAASNSRRPADSDFYQQRMKAWQPILTPKWVIITFAIIGIPFIVIGFLLKGASDSVVEYSQQYDGLPTSQFSSCHVEPYTNTTKTCTLTFNVETTMKAPVYLYYQLDNFYQNHRRYVKSRNDKQLAGTLYTSTSDLADCDPLRTANSKILDPCGLIAYSVFNDSFVITNPAITMLETGIAWPSDLKKFSDPTPAQKLEYNNTITFLSDLYPTIANVTNEHFIVWMRVAALPNFRKLYGRIETDIPAGTTVTVQISPRYPVTPFEGKKSIVLSTVSFLGGKNAFLGIAYIVVGFICIVLAIGFGVRQLFGGRRLGDTTYLAWSTR